MHVLTAAIGVVGDAVVDVVAPRAGVLLEEREIVANKRSGKDAPAVGSMNEQRVFADIFSACGVNGALFMNGWIEERALTENMRRRKWRDVRQSSGL